MPAVINSARNKRKSRRPINVHQNKFPKAYISTMDNSRRPQDSLSDLTNMEVVQDYVVRPRPPLVRYGTQPDLPVIGRGKIRFGGQRSLLWMLNDSGTGKLYKQTDGGAFGLVDGGGTYDDEAWASNVQSKGRAYIFNSVDNLSYIDLTDDTIHTYTSLSTPSITSVVKSGMAGTAFTHYYRVSANNDVGESIASAAGSVTSGKVRDAWIENTDFITVTLSGTVTGATSYTYYYGDSPDTLNELYTVAGNGNITFIDYGTLAVNPFKLAPEGNSTEGAVFTWMYVDTKNSQIFGITADNYLYYSAAGTGDFSPYNGGGYVGIDIDGDTELNFVDGFRNGKGDPVITVSARGAAGKGKLYHVSFDSLTVGDQVIIFPNVSEANGQSGTYSARATVKGRDSLWYPTGLDFKSTGTSQNIMNILTTNSVSQVMEPDVDRISLQYLHKAVAVEVKDRLYFALPVGSTENNEIWYIDLSRKNLWVLRWSVAAKDLWLYEDNDGATHFCALVNDVILEFTRAGSQTHQDDGVAWRSRVAFESMVWDEDGIILGKVRRQYFKFLFPKGSIMVNATGLTRAGVQSAVGSDTFTTTTTPTGIGQWFYSAGHQYGEDPGQIRTYGRSVAVLEIKPKGLLAQLDWEVVGETGGTDYILSAVNTKGFALDDLVLKAG
jgi:hypothetical protein